MHVTPMLHVPIQMAAILVNALKDFPVMANYVKILTNVAQKSSTGAIKAPSVLTPLATIPVNVCLVTRETVIIARM